MVGKMKKLIIILLLLLVTDSYCQTLSPKRDSLMQQLADWAQLNATGDNYIDTTAMFRALSWGARATCQDFPAYERFDTVMVDSASEGGALPGDFSRMLGPNSAFLIVENTKEIMRLPLQMWPQDTMFLNRESNLQWLMKLADKLSVSYWEVHAEKLILHPKWFRGGDTAKVLIQYYAIDTTHLAAADSSLKIRAKYLDKVIMYATSRLYAMRYEFDRADWWMKEYEKGVIKDED